jgi:hypothetical protein
MCNTKTELEKKVRNFAEKLINYKLKYDLEFKK